MLRHAWLNLWDKHMTTGRINQVTIMNLLKAHCNAVTQILCSICSIQQQFHHIVHLNHHSNHFPMANPTLLTNPDEPVMRQAEKQLQLMACCQILALHNNHCHLFINEHKFFKYCSPSISPQNNLLAIKAFYLYQTKDHSIKCLHGKLCKKLGSWEKMVAKCKAN